ncbi:hypothetical protein MRX96_031846 [Rhipicephalus microplus]
MEDNEDAPVMAGTVPRQKVTARCKSIDRYGDSDVDLTRKRSFADEYFKRVARDLKSIPCLLLLGNIFAFVFLIIWSNITKHLFVTQKPTEVTTPAETSPPLIRSIREMHMCNKPRCGAVGHAINYGVDVDILPCKDILEHACGRWIRADEEIYQKWMLGSARLYIDDMYSDLKRYLETMPLRCRCERSTRCQFFIVGWPFESTFKPYESILAKFLRRTSEPALLSIGTARMLRITRASSDIDDEGSNDILLSLDCPRFPFPRYWLLTRNDADKNDYTALVMNLIKLYKNVDVPLSLVKNIVSFEINNAYVTRRYCHRRKLRRYPLGQLKEKVKKFPWDSFLQEVVGNDTGIVIDDNTKVLLRSFDYLKYMASLRNPPKEGRAVNYIGWRIFYFYGPLAFPALRSKITEFRSLKLNESHIEEWKKCLFITNDVMPIGMGRVYVEAMTRMKTLFAVQELVSKVIFSFKYMLSQAMWLDSEAKVNASNYLTKLNTMVGIPKWVADDNTLDRYYESFTFDITKDAFFTMFDLATRHTAKYRFLPLFQQLSNRFLRSHYRLGRLVADNHTNNDDLLKGINMRPLHSFIFPGHIADLYLHRYNMRQALVFDVNENALLLPAGLLQPPYFDPNVPLAINYGGLGVLILHDMVREFFRFFFDDTDARWRKRTRCINNKVFRKTEESSGSLDENQEHEVVTFTMMTVRAAYNAYHYALGTDDDDIVPGGSVESNPDQLFMLSTVRTLCSIVRDRNFALVELGKDTLLLRKITAALQGLDELQDAFRCSSDKRNAYYHCLESAHPTEE